MPFAKLEQQTGAFDAVSRFERAGRVVHPGMDDLTVVGARGHARPRLALEHTHAITASRHGERPCEPDDAGADDDVSISSMRCKLGNGPFLTL